VKAQFVYRFWY